MNKVLNFAWNKRKEANVFTRSSAYKPTSEMTLYTIECECATFSAHAVIEKWCSRCSYLRRDHHTACLCVLSAERQTLKIQASACGWCILARACAWMCVFARKRIRIATWLLSSLRSVHSPVPLPTLDVHLYASAGSPLPSWSYTQKNMNESGDYSHLVRADIPNGFACSCVH